jgi:hypothetical protein
LTAPGDGALWIRARIRVDECQQNDLTHRALNGLASAEKHT